MLLVRPVMASSVNHVRAVFSPHATLLNTLYATAMLQQEVPCEERSAGSFELPFLNTQPGEGKEREVRENEWVFLSACHAAPLADNRTPVSYARQEKHDSKTDSRADRPRSTPLDNNRQQEHIPGPTSTYTLLLRGSKRASRGVRLSPLIFFCIAVRYDKSYDNVERVYYERSNPITNNEQRN